MLDIKIELKNLERVREHLDKLSGPEAKEAYAQALNDVGKHVQARMKKEIRAEFDRPTKHIFDSPKYVPATAKKLSVWVGPTMDARNAPSAGGKVGVDPQKILQAQEFGGKRRDKRSESALRRAGFLPMGFQTAIPAEPFPGSDDGRGNLRGAFLQQLLSYLHAYSEQGFKANMSAKRKGNIHRGTAKAQGRRYFVSYGKWRDGRAAHLAPGVWAASGTGGVVLRPVLMFVRPPSYRPRLSMDRIARESGAQEYLDKRVRFRIREAAGV